MDLDILVQEIINNCSNKQMILLEEIEKLWSNKFSINKKEVLQCLLELKSSRYCLPLVKAPIKINFITLPSWGTKKKSYRINGLNYTCIELYESE